MNVLILEDEHAAAERFKRMLLDLRPGANVLAVLDTVSDAVTWFANHHQPDLLFCDIQLADTLSFELFKQVNITAPVIFITAFDEFAIQAFKVNSVDYLLKPLKRDDLEQALDKYDRSHGATQPFKKLL